MVMKIEEKLPRYEKHRFLHKKKQKPRRDRKKQDLVGENSRGNW